MPNAYLLNEDDVQAIKDLMEKVRAMPDAPLRYDVPIVPHSAPEVYIALVPVSGIPALEIAGSGSGSITSADYTAAGSTECQIFRIIDDVTDELIPIDGLTKLVYNLSRDVIEADTWILAVRDKHGNWIAAMPAGAAITSINGDTTPAQLITSEDGSVTITQPAPGTTDLSVGCCSGFAEMWFSDLQDSGESGEGITIGGLSPIGDDLDGSYSWAWTCPPGITEITVDGIGKGGYGGTGDFGEQVIFGDEENGEFTVDSTSLNGGGGGAFSRVVLSTVPGTVYTCIIERNTVLGTQFKLEGTTLLRAASGNNGRDGYAGGGPMLGGQASDGIGDIKFSGGDGATGVGFNYTNGTLDSSFGEFSYAGGGGGSGGPDGDGLNGQLAYEYMDNPIAGLGGKLYGRGGNGYMSDFFGFFVEEPSTNGFDGGGGGGGGTASASYGWDPLDVDPLNPLYPEDWWEPAGVPGLGGRGIIRITWGTVTTINGKTGTITLVGGDKVNITSGDNGTFVVDVGDLDATDIDYRPTTPGDWP